MKQRVVTLFLALVMALALLPASVLAVDGENQEAPSTTTTVREGLWITEVYPAAATTTGEGTYEFVELTNTTDAAISLNDSYQLLYGSNKDSVSSVTVATFEGETDVTIPAGETVVIWNRTDGSTLEQFRTEFYLLDSVPIYVTQGSGAWEDQSGYFALQTTGDGGEIVSEISYSKTEVKAGRSVKLGIPDFGSQMMVLTNQTYPSPGYVTSNQMGGISSTHVSEEPDGLYLTEVHADDKKRSEDFDTATGELMEFIELTNTTDTEINLYEDGYELWFLKSNSNTQMPAMSYEHARQFAESKTTEADALKQVPLEGDEIVIPANGTAVFWIYYPAANDTLANYPTEEDFREAYGISEDVPVYALYHEGFGNADKGAAVIKTEGGQKVLQSFYYLLEGRNRR